MIKTKFLAILEYQFFLIFCHQGLEVSCECSMEHYHKLCVFKTAEMYSLMVLGTGKSCISSTRLVPRCCWEGQTPSGCFWGEAVPGTSGSHWLMTLPVSWPHHPGGLNVPLCSTVTLPLLCVCAATRLPLPSPYELPMIPWRTPP